MLGKCHSWTITGDYSVELALVFPSSEVSVILNHGTANSGFCFIGSGRVLFSAYGIHLI